LYDNKKNNFNLEYLTFEKISQLMNDVFYFASINTIIEREKQITLNQLQKKKHEVSKKNV
jgi:hypothetical protein